MGHGVINYSLNNRTLTPHTDVDWPYRRRGFGTKLYEAIYAHALKLGIVDIEGGKHTENAHRLHESVTKKHNIKGYEASELPDEFMEQKGFGPYDYKTVPNEAGEESMLKIFYDRTK